MDLRVLVAPVQHLHEFVARGHGAEDGSVHARYGEDRATLCVLAGGAIGAEGRRGVLDLTFMISARVRSGSAAS